MTTFPAFANCHSHAFHRALRGRPGPSTVSISDTFWSWREGMYAVAAVLDPDLYFRLARATFAEMRLAGIGAVAEFHYVHHAPSGTPYRDPNAMSDAVIAAAVEVGIRLCLLQTCYLRAGFEGEPLNDVQLRFSDRTVSGWAERVATLRAVHPDSERLRIGAAIHSVRAVAPDDLALVASAFPGAPLHVHVSEQKDENRACLAATGRTPVQLLAEAGVWGPNTTAVHATHLTADDIAILADAGATACLCPSTEAELADGIGPSVALREAGVRITLGSDSHTAIDMFHEARALAMHERLASGVRDGWAAHDLWKAATVDGYASLGFAPGDEFALRESVRIAGAPEPLWAATANDVVPRLDPDVVASELAWVIDEIGRRL